MSNRKRVILIMRYHIIEPLGMLYLAGVAKKLGWEAKVILVKNFDFESVFREAISFKPDIVGFSIWTGYHIQTFAACDKILAMGIPVVIGGPHATFATEQCALHATWVVKGEGFRNFRRILEGELEPGVHFDDIRMAEGFPKPDRKLVYDDYPELGENPIKSIVASVGCPFKCSYCYAPHYNNMYGGFELNLRPIGEIVAEALAIKENWPVQMIYFQDDIFGFNMPWLRQFVKKWSELVKIPWHCQIRLELTRDTERLELFREGGCTGITLAIESGNEFLRQFVLLRPMADELIVEGIRKIQRLGFSLRTEQILSVPFSGIKTDIQTLELNNRLGPEMAWTSILSPYGGTNMGAIAKQFLFFDKDNDALNDTFFNRSVLHHSRDGIVSVQPTVSKLMKDRFDNPLLRMEARKNGDFKADVYLKNLNNSSPICALEYLSVEENERYCDQTVVLQRLFDWLSHVPNGSRLATKIVNLRKDEWSWKRIGRMTEEHLESEGYKDRMPEWRQKLADEMHCLPDKLPKGVDENPYYFCFFPSSGEFAKKFLKDGFFNIPGFWEQLSFAGREVRYWLYSRALYKLEIAKPPIAKIQN
ncbi:MAG: cobalamin-dependent protein [Candidatus Jorgensenbacteria bacterium]